MRHIFCTSILLLCSISLFANNFIINLDGRITNRVLLNILDDIEDKVQVQPSNKTNQKKIKLIDASREILFENHNQITSKLYYDHVTLELTYNIRPPSSPDNKSIYTIVFSEVDDKQWKKIEASSKPLNISRLENNLTNVFLHQPIIDTNFNIN